MGTHMPLSLLHVDRRLRVVPVQHKMVLCRRRLVALGTIPRTPHPSTWKSAASGLKIASKNHVYLRRTRLLYGHFSDHRKFRYGRAGIRCGVSMYFMSSELLVW